MPSKKRTWALLDMIFDFALGPPPPGDPGGGSGLSFVLRDRALLGRCRPGSGGKCILNLHVGPTFCCWSLGFSSAAGGWGIIKTTSSPRLLFFEKGPLFSYVWSTGFSSCRPGIGLLSRGGLSIGSQGYPPRTSTPSGATRFLRIGRLEWAIGTSKRTGRPSPEPSEGREGTGFH